MNLQKRLAASVMNCSPKRVVFNPEKLGEIKDAITKTDINKLIKQGIIHEKPKQSISRGRTRHLQQQKRKGRRQGQGSRKGRHNARLNDKDVWVSSVRLQRQFLKTLRDKKYLTTEQYRIMYAKSKGGFFRSLRHLKVYLTEQALIKK